MINDTIAAISTPIARGGIGIIRLSGPQSKTITEKIFTASLEKSHTIRYGFIFDSKTGETIDEVLVSYMKAPKTYTMEDVVEINCHSGIAVLGRILSIVLENGARPAENGEFTKRAFLNGRIDLTQAEAVADIINARTEMSRQAAANQLSGRLFQRIKGYMDSILSCLANIEVSIDYPEHDDLPEQQRFLRETITQLRTQAQQLYETAEKGRIIREGIRTVILGQTNVGKSSLLNYFSGEERAIVTDIHGTTRDILEESVNLGGILLKMVDTAGIRETDDLVEQIGIDKAKKAAEAADLVLCLYDGSKDYAPLALPAETTAKKIALINKIDLAQRVDTAAIRKAFGAENTILISVKTGEGLPLLEERIRQLFISGEITADQEEMISNLRQKTALYHCIQSLDRCLESIADGFPEDIVSVDLMAAYNYLAEITGEAIDENLADKIFSEFCLGK